MRTNELILYKDMEHFLWRTIIMNITMRTI